MVTSVNFQYDGSFDHLDHSVAFYVFNGLTTLGVANLLSIGLYTIGRYM